MEILVPSAIKTVCSEAPCSATILSYLYRITQIYSGSFIIAISIKWHVMFTVSIHLHSLANSNYPTHSIDCLILLNSHSTDWLIHHSLHSSNLLNSIDHPIHLSHDLLHSINPYDLLYSLRSTINHPFTHSTINYHSLHSTVDLLLFIHFLHSIHFPLLPLLLTLLYSILAPPYFIQYPINVLTLSTTSLPTDPITDFMNGLTSDGY